ncbi:putative intracellular protease/amidase [Mycobacterium sp. JS623]|uniref:type 1 glutamine amidotransferase domain-containing protein n=1 Tax=Mycobacterium sp. JS623 TaxID=212767 RepID=UPI0002A571B7|nr:type 1 glutamine amidotransferase domain-containing protein [Mycobacterium sp. JS623]AGB22094.1 putative intracellular protease/amidase [Mycobacterium sp. JS623]
MNEIPTVAMLLPAVDYDPTESAVIWDALTSSGVEVRFATPDGEPAYADARLVDKGFSVLSPVLMTRPEPLKAYQRMISDPHFLRASAYEDVEAGGIDGVLVPGGHAKGVRTLLESSAAQAVAATAMSRNIPVGAVCHGVLLLARSIDPSTGRSVLYGRRTTALTAALELGGWAMTRLWLGDYYRTYPTTVQAEVTAALASPNDFEIGPRMTLRDSPNHLDRGFTVKDRNYLSARWPGDCYRLAADYVDMVWTAYRSGE